MKHPRLTGIALAFGLGASACALADSVMQPGAWEMQMKVSAKDPQSGETKNISEALTKICLTKGFLDRDPYLKPTIDQEKMARRGANCSIGDEKLSPGTASWKMSCRLQDGSVTEGQINTSASARELRSEMTQIVTKEGHVTHMYVITTSRHIGECTSDMLKL